VTGYHAMGGTDYMVHGKNSACEKFGDPEPIADNLVRFMREPAWAEALGQGGAETAARYSEEAFVDRWTRYLHGLLRS
jgi:glycosyltransferase involved in cell wall biosynthesis